MTTTPNEPVQDPDIHPSGDPVPVDPDVAPAPGEHPEPPLGDTDTDPDESEAAPGQMPESTNTEVGA